MTESQTDGPVRAIRAEWPFWVVAAVALAVAAYFYATEALVADYTAESFYAILFGILALAASGYGVVRTRDRMRKYDF